MGQFERQLRRQQTDAEKRLWYHLRDRSMGGRKFRRQHRVGPYVVDFICLEAGLVIEIDGGQHLAHAAYDARRTAYLECLGLRVLRFWNDQVLAECEAVLESILRSLGPSPQPSPRKRGEGSDG